MVDSEIPLHCPQCNERVMRVTAELDLDKPFTCEHCGVSVNVRELKTSAGKTLMEHATDIAKEAFKGFNLK